MINSIIGCFDPFARFPYADVQGVTESRIAGWPQFYIGCTVRAAEGPLIRSLVFSF
jgi:hypothetical protein